VRRLFSRATRLAEDLGIRAGVLPYRRRWLLNAADWDREYASGRLNYYGAFRERGRYGVLLAYLSGREGPMRLLDFGCGTGILRHRLAHLPISEYVGIDPSAEAIEAARKEHGDAGRFHVADQVDASMGMFDVIVCNEVLYYVEDLPATLERLRGSLKPGGWVMTSVVRHPGDIAIERALKASFDLVDSVYVKRRVEPRNGWTVSCYARPSGEAERSGR
jgi:2-polyprenyl-3-methyl-5-hydroxy-6-metoxy-1,4-benzoquinol methylase